MRKTRVKRLRKNFEETIVNLPSEQQMRNSSEYKKRWRIYKVRHR